MKGFAVSPEDIFDSFFFSSDLHIEEKKGTEETFFFFPKWGEGRGERSPAEVENLKNPLNRSKVS